MSYPKVRHNWNGKEFPTDHEVNDLPSETVPDQSMSVKELLERYARGIPLTDSGRIPIWYTDEELKENREIMNIPDIEKLDISERYELIEMQKERVQEIKDQLKAKQAQEKERIIKEAQKRIQEAKAKEQNLPGAPSAPEPRQSNRNETSQ